MNQTIEFALWNIKAKVPKKFTLQVNIGGFLHDVKPWKANQIAFFINDFEDKPKMIIYLR